MRAVACRDPFAREFGGGRSMLPCQRFDAPDISRADLGG
jgi:hypothetical protein